MAVMGSRSDTPTAEEALLIREAIQAEGEDRILACIENYRERLDDMKSWTVLSANKFFRRKTYSMFLRTDHSETTERSKRRPLREVE